jgi:glutathione S-transferase
MTITITAFERSPDGGKGLARDTRVRWALEEVGQPYEVRLVSFGAMKESAHLALHPFGQIPTYEEGDLGLFETGAIVFHVAERHAGLLPTMRMPGRALSHGCSPRSAQWSRLSLSS